MYRQLPCANRYLSEKWQREENERIRLSHKRMKAAVDNSEPPRYRHLEYNAKRAAMAKEREREIDYDNRKLLETIRYQHSQKHPGALDDRMVEVGPKSLHSAVREKELQRIVAENQRMYRMLSKPRPNIRVEDLEREFQENEYHTGHLRVVRPEQGARDSAGQTGRAGRTGRTGRTGGAGGTGRVGTSGASAAGADSASKPGASTGASAGATGASRASGTQRGTKKGGSTAKPTGSKATGSPQQVQQTGDSQIEQVYGEQPGLAEAEAAGQGSQSVSSPTPAARQGEEGYLISPTPEEGQKAPGTPARDQPEARGDTFLTDTVDVQF